MISCGLVATFGNGGLKIYIFDQALSSHEKYEILSSAAYLFTVLVHMCLCICFPKFTTPLLMEMKFISSILLSYLNYRRFNGREICDKPLEVQMKHLEIMNKIQTDVINIFII